MASANKPTEIIIISDFKNSCCYIFPFNFSCISTLAATSKAMDPTPLITLLQQKDHFALQLCDSKPAADKRDQCFTLILKVLKNFGSIAREGLIASQE